MVYSVMGLEVSEPEVPVHVSPLPVTVQETALLVDQVIVALSPEGTKRGVVEMFPVMAL